MKSMKRFFVGAIMLCLLSLSANVAQAQRLDSRDTSQLFDNTIFATQDTNAQGSYRWSQTPYSVLRDSIHASYNSSYFPLRFGAPTFKSHLDSPGTSSFGNGTSIEFGDTTHFSITNPEPYPLDFYESEFNLFQSFPFANLADTSTFRTSIFGIWNGNINQITNGNGSITLNQVSISSRPNIVIYQNPTTRFAANRIGTAGSQKNGTNGKKPEYLNPPTHYNVVGTIAAASVPRDGDPYRRRGAVIGSWGISTGSDTIRLGQNINSQFRLALARNKSNALELAFYISDTTFKWQGEMYESDNSGVAFFDDKGALHKDETGYQVQALVHKALTYQPANATDFQAELADRTDVPDGAKFYFHASASLTYEYIYDKPQDKLKRVMYSDF